jgi:hypothetical protein
MIFKECCPKAGPTGGAGVALPAGICNFIYAVIFLAIYSSPKCGFNAKAIGSHLIKQN